MNEKKKKINEIGLFLIKTLINWLFTTKNKHLIDQTGEYLSICIDRKANDKTLMGIKTECARDGWLEILPPGPCVTSAREGYGGLLWQTMERPHADISGQVEWMKDVMVALQHDQRSACVWNMAIPVLKPEKKMLFWWRKACMMKGLTLWYKTSEVLKAKKMKILKNDKDR